VVEAVLAHQAAFVTAALRPDEEPHLLEAWLADDRLRGTLRVHEFEGTWWFEKEAFEEMVAAFLAAAEVTLAAERSLAPRTRTARIDACRELAARLVARAAGGGYRLERLVALARG
jgi:hypothetical protein